MADTVNEGWPLVEAAQAQKHVTVNDALNQIDTRIATWFRVNWTFTDVVGGDLEVTSSAVVVRPETGTSDDVNTISGGADGTVVILSGEAGNVINVIDGGNLKLGDTSRVLNNFDDTLTLIKRGTDWLEISFSNNG